MELPETLQEGLIIRNHTYSTVSNAALAAGNNTSNLPFARDTGAPGCGDRTLQILVDKHHSQFVVIPQNGVGGEVGRRAALFRHHMTAGGLVKQQHAVVDRSRMVIAVEKVNRRIAPRRITSVKIDARSAMLSHLEKEVRPPECRDEHIAEARFASSRCGVAFPEAPREARRCRKPRP